MSNTGNGPSPLQAALIALSNTKPGSAEFTAAFEHVEALRAERPTAEGVERTVPCGFGTCSRLFVSEVGANGHKPGRKTLPDGTPNPEFCTGAAAYQAGKALAARTSW